MSRVKTTVLPRDIYVNVSYSATSMPVYYRYCIRCYCSVRLRQWCFLRMFVLRVLVPVFCKGYRFFTIFAPRGRNGGHVVLPCPVDTPATQKVPAVSTSALCVSSRRAVGTVFPDVLTISIYRREDFRFATPHVPLCVRVRETIKLESSSLLQSKFGTSAMLR